MAGRLNHTPAQILQKVLVQLELGSTAPSNSWPVYSPVEANQPDNCITVQNTGGRKDGRLMTDGEEQEHYGIQVRIRAAADVQAFAKANEVAEVLAKDLYDESVTISSSTYLVHSFSRTGTILALGYDNPNSKRTIYVINGLVCLKKTS